MDVKKPTIAVLQGDPAGIGPELLVKLLNSDDVSQSANILIIGDPRVFAAGEEIAGKTGCNIKHISEPSEIDGIDDSIFHLDLHIDDIENAPFSKVSAPGGRSSIAALHQALQLTRQGLVDGICFMPFNKESMHLGGNAYKDELGYAKHFLGVESMVSEFNVAHGMWNGRVTSHVAMKDVPSLLTQERISNGIELADRTLRLAGYDRPRIVVAAYNPHAGEGGLMGREEIDVIIPAVHEMQEKQINVAGPFPADTLWLKVRDGHYDAVVTMYHDQGQIAIKLLGFDEGVSVLAGLPVPITTPAHGTAFDIAGQNRANLKPTRNAYDMVVQMARQNLGREDSSLCA